MDMQGSRAWFTMKVFATVLMVFLIVPSANPETPLVCEGWDLKNGIDRVMSWFLSGGCSNCSMNGSYSSLIDLRNDVHLLYDAELKHLYCVLYGFRTEIRAFVEPIW